MTLMLPGVDVAFKPLFRGERGKHILADLPEKDSGQFPPFAYRPFSCSLSVMMMIPRLRLLTGREGQGCLKTGSPQNNERCFSSSLMKKLATTPGR
jgi:hypothetical protein